MAILEVKDLNYSIKNRLLYKDVAFNLYKGDKMGVVGQNGAGKSTLINILVGKVEHDQGSITWQKDARIGYLDQHAEIEKDVSIMEFLKLSFAPLFAAEQELNKVYEQMGVEMTDKLTEKAEELSNKLMYSGFYDLDSTINKIAAGLGIQKLGMDTLLSKISGGQRAKVILAKLLLEKPDVLMMDEPTNFLDKEHVDWLARYLNDFDGCYIIVSHDFTFLNNVTNCIIDIEFQNIKKYTGNFQQYLKLKEENRKNYEMQYEKQQKTITHLQEYYDKNHARASTAKSAQSKLKQMERMDVLPPAKDLPKPDFKFKSEYLRDGIILEVNDLLVGYDHVLLPPLKYTINAGEKIIITGFNGIGKSTMIKTLLGLIPKLGGEYKWTSDCKFGYFDQDLNWPNPNASAFDIIKDAFPKFDDVTARKYLAQCAVKGQIAMRPISTLSGGEQVKVKLCILMLTKCNVLVLDEVTNHIDEASKEVLKEQLIAWEGVILLITHEHSFYQGWSTKVIQINKK